MDTDPRPKPLGNESADPFSPTLPPGSLHEVLRQEEEEEEEGGEQQTPASPPTPDKGEKSPGNA